MGSRSLGAFLFGIAAVFAAPAATSQDRNAKILKTLNLKVE